MTNLKRLLVGAIAVLATTAIIPTVGASASTLDGGKGYSISQNFEARDVLGVSQAKGLFSNTNKAVASTTKSTTTTATTTTSTAKATTAVATAKHAVGWVKEADGFWRYGNADGTAKTGWFNDGGTWYYLYKSLDGGMASNCYVGQYKLTSSGAWDTSAPVPSTRQGQFGTEYLGESLGSVYYNSQFKSAYTVPLRLIDDLISQGKLAQGTFTNSNAGQLTGWYLK